MDTIYSVVIRLSDSRIFPVPAARSVGLRWGYFLDTLAVVAGRCAGPGGRGGPVQSHTGSRCSNTRRDHGNCREHGNRGTWSAVRCCRPCCPGTGRPRALSVKWVTPSSPAFSPSCSPFLSSQSSSSSSASPPSSALSGESNYISTVATQFVWDCSGCYWWCCV